MKNDIIEEVIDLLSDREDCQMCNGMGWNYNNYPDNIDDPTEYPCISCNGTGKIYRHSMENK